VHTTEDIYRASHIDSTVIALRPGLVLLNASRVTPKNCPDVFARWDKIYFRDIVPTPPETLEFHKLTRKRIHDRLAEIGIVTDVDHLASDWIGMNVLSLDQQTVVVDKRQTALIKTLESYGLTTVPIPFRHAHLLKGGIHCSTLDTVRESRLESYCD
jgi:glycine amidinotransferase/scyllo-inosamine-4-phosphate amidinotransferase 1